jgi:hypothetical protein
MKSTEELQVNDNLLYVANGYDGFRVIDPKTLESLGDYKNPDFPQVSYFGFDREHVYTLGVEMNGRNRLSVYKKK